jgi:hypothetical protein
MDLNGAGRDCAGPQPHPAYFFFFFERLAVFFAGFFAFAFFLAAIASLHGK